MAEVPTYFPPQTYSSSFFLNSIVEEDKASSKNKVRQKDESETSPLLDCFIKTTTKMRSSTIIFLIVYQILKPTSAVQCNSEKYPEIRTFGNLSLYQGNKITFDAIQSDFKGNFAVLQKTKRILEKNDFITYTSDFLMRLFINHTGIENIHADAFLGLHCLESLDLQSNQIDYIQPDAFRSLEHLRHLNLSYNKIKRIDDGILNNLVRLKTIDLSHNEISQILERAFHNLYFLEHLDLSFNKLIQIKLEEWDGLFNVTIMDLSHNNLVELDIPNSFVFKRMTRLYLNSNLLTKISPSNKIKTQFPALVMLTLSGNRWKCDDLSKIFTDLNDTRMYFDAKNETTSNINGIDCISSIVTSSTTELVNNSTFTTPSSILNEDFHNIQIANKEILEEISSLRGTIISLIVFICVIILLEFIVKSGLIYKIKYFRRGNQDDILYDTSIENIRLLPPRAN